MKALNVVQIIIAILLTVSVLMQNQGTGLSAGIGGGSESYHTKRGAEKIVYYATIVLAALFTLVSILALV